MPPSKKFIRIILYSEWEPNTVKQTEMRTQEPLRKKQTGIRTQEPPFGVKQTGMRTQEPLFGEGWFSCPGCGLDAPGAVEPSFIYEIWIVQNMQFFLHAPWVSACICCTSSPSQGCGLMIRHADQQFLFLPPCIRVASMCSMHACVCVIWCHGEF